MSLCLFSWQRVICDAPPAGTTTEMVLVTLTGFYICVSGQILVNVMTAVKGIVKMKGHLKDGCSLTHEH